jgi:hypothetical protein
MSTKIYALSPAGIKKEKRYAFIRSAFLTLFAFAVGLGFPLIAGLIEVQIIIFVIPVILVALGVGMRRGYKILQERWASFQILLSQENILRKQMGLPDIEIERDQVSQIQERTAGIFVRTLDKNKYIHLPKGLEDYEDARMMLEQWRVIEIVSPAKDRASLLTYILLFFLALSFGVIFLSHTVWLMILAGIFIVSYTLWEQLSIRQNPEVDARVKSGIWQTVFLVLALVGIVAGRIFAVLSR